MLTLLLALQASVSVPPTSRTPADVASLVARARSARFQQDSALGRYEAIARMRMSIKIGLSRSLGLGPLTPERLAARFESVARVGWDHALGAWAELLGVRSVMPIAGMVEPQGD